MKPLSDTPRTDAAINQRRYYEKRGDWYGDDVFLYVEVNDARAIERELLEEIARLQALLAEKS